MNNQILSVGIIAILIGGIAGYSIAKYEKQTGNIPLGIHRMSDGTMMHDTNKCTGGATNNMDHMMSMLVTSELDFIDGMIPHHQEAVDTAREVIARGGTTPEIKQLVEDIVVAQEKEIAEMKVWYSAWYNKPYKDNGKYSPMMRELSTLSGKELDRAFLEDMIMHHMGAIMMAQSVQPYIEHPEMEKLTQAVISTQSTEIGQMRQMLRSL